MPRVFEESTLAGMRLENRLVRSATWEGLADAEGRVTDRLVGVYDRLAKGGVGLVISSYMFVDIEGRQPPDQIGAHRDDLVPGLARLAEAVHRGSGSIVAQIVHCGGQAASATDPVAPSAVASPGYPKTPRQLSLAEIEGVIASFAASARRVKEAGYDGVQLHGAHGYLLAQFLSPLRNRREDRYGGSLEGRARFALEVYRAVRQEVGPGFPVMIKLNASDFLEGSTTEADAAHLADALARAGIDAIEVSGGTPGSGKLGAARPDIATAEDEAYFRPQARIIRQAAPEVPLMLVGGLRSLDVIEQILEAGEADYFSLCRPLIREPDLPLRWSRGDRRRADCVSCLGCFGPTRRGEGLRCVKAEPEAGGGAGAAR
jgi:2,4-dienoyl-CoA reductase-like NADH-dependent reductase (Old Yellow Enzyme family)